MKEPLVSIIVVNWNGGEIFKNCLTSLKKINYQNWELILVDNASSDNSQKLPKSLSIKNYKLILNKTNLGFALANNQAVKIAKGKYLLLLNNDTIVPQNFLNILVKKMESDNSIGVLQPKILMMDKKGYLDNAGSFMTKIGFLDHWGFGKKDNTEFSKETKIFSAKGACMLIRHDIVKKIGLFDKDFVSYFEESDFCWRVWLMGLRVVYYPKTYIYHKVGFTIKRLDVLNINFHYYKNRIISLYKNLGKANFILILPIHIFISLAISLLFLLILKPKNSLIVLKAIYWNIKNIKVISKKRKNIQNARIFSDKELFEVHKLMHKINWKKFYFDFLRIKRDIEESSY